MTPRDERHGIDALRSVAHVGYLGFAMAVPIAAGAWLGSLVDRKIGGKGLFVILGVLMGVAAGALSAYRIIVQVFTQAKTGGTKSNSTHDGNERDDG